MITITKTEHGYSAVRTKDKTMHTTKHTPFKCWLWPNHVISKRDSGSFREEHNALVNAYYESLEALKAAQRFFDVLQEHYQDVFEFNSNDADGLLDWDVRMKIQDAIAKAGQGKE